MSLPSYETYKESGVDWLGRVPAHWAVVPIKFLSPVLRGASPRPIDDHRYFDDEGQYAWVRIADATASKGVLLETTQRMSELGSSLSVKLEPGTLFVSIAGTVGKPCITGIKACIHDGFVYFPHLGLDPRLLYRLFESGACYAGLGKMGTQLNLNTDTIGSIRVAVPPPIELQNLLVFLDRETAKIDELIAEQEKLIALLAEKRQATITQAVTRGLNPLAETKHSCISWIGEMPSHWAAVPLKRLCKLLRDGTHLPPPRVDEGVRLLSVRNIDRSTFALREDDSMISEADYAELCRAFVPLAGDVLLAIVGATLGKVAVVPDGIGRFHIQRSLAIFRAEEGVLSDWLFYCMSSGAFQRMLWENVGFSAQPGIYLGTLKDFFLPIPPIREQRETIAFIEAEIARLDLLQSKAESAVALLSERRSALISAAVTGQIDVREVATEPAA